MGGKYSGESRRSFLKSTGLAVSGFTTLGGVETVSGSTGKPPKNAPHNGGGQSNGLPAGAYKALLRKRKRKGWSTDRWRSELAKRGATFTYMDSRVRVSHPDEMNVRTLNSSEEPVVTVDRLKPIDERQDTSDVGIQWMDKDDARLELTYTAGYYDTRYRWHPPRIDFSWSLKDPWSASVGKPLDLALLSIDPDQYTWGRDIEYGKYASASNSVDSMSFGHRCAEYNASSHSDMTIGRFGSYLNVPLEPISGSPDTRRIYIDYVALWEDAKVESMSFSSGGDVSITISNSTDSWRAETYADESEMDDGETYTKDDF